MGIWEVALIGVALAMDACAVAMTNGMTDNKMPVWKALLVGVFFGVFQFLMPLIGYYITGVIADAFLDTFKSISAWISFALLAFLGGKMLFECISETIKEKRENQETGGACTRLSCEACQPKLTIGKLTLQAIATSIDALAVGVTLQMAAITEGLAMGAWGSTVLIGVITFGLSVGAVYIGKLVGNKLADKAGIVGGIVLLGIGLKILIESFL
ncbi:MAG: manganese efflux pump [Clostridia bacterium]|nr:manganese efflux pump [Clostridia bacterium]